MTDEQISQLIDSCVIVNKEELHSQIKRLIKKAWQEGFECGKELGRAEKP